MKMRELGLAVFFVLFSLAGSTQPEVIFLADKPFERVQVSRGTSLECCFKNGPSDLVWIKRNVSGHINRVNETDDIKQQQPTDSGDEKCGKLHFTSVKLNDTGLYQCFLNRSGVFTPGTYLQVYKPMEKLINLSESTKNTILTVEGILLLLCVLVPSAMLLFKSKTLHELEMKKMKREEENIYQGLNLDDCCSTYDQIEHSRAQGPYQDVANITEETGEIQLEKP